MPNLEIVSTPLHVGALMGNKDFARFQVTHDETKNILRGDVEDRLGQTAFELAELEWQELQRVIIGV